MKDLASAVERVQDFVKGSFKQQVTTIERRITNQSSEKILPLTNEFGVDLSLLLGALTIKQVFGQINEIIHAVGILLLLPYILSTDEVIESVSLAAGNTGKAFDLETNLRIAEFKFIHWKGGAEAIRQNSLFKDFYYLAEKDTHKQRCLYVLGTNHPLRFLNGQRSLKSVMSKDLELLKDFQLKYGERFIHVSEYFHHWPPDRVQIVDVIAFIPNFAAFSESG